MQVYVRQRETLNCGFSVDIQIVTIFSQIHNTLSICKTTELALHHLDGKC